jgi:hypothetical protein
MMNRHDHDVLGLRSVGDTVPEVDLLAKARARQRLLASIASGRSHRMSAPRRAVAAISVTLLLALLAADLPTLREEEAAAAAVFRELAGNAERGSTLPGSGSYVHMHSSGIQLVEGTDVGSQTSWSAVVSFQRDVWLRSDGAGRLAESRTDSVFLSPADEAAWEAAGSPAVEMTNDGRYGPGELYIVDPSSVPEEVDALRSALEDRTLGSGPDGDAQTLRIIGGLLAESYLSPQQRSSLFTVASELSGIGSLGELTDHLGRTGPAVSAEDALGQVVLIFDADSSRLLELRTSWPTLGISTWSSFREPTLVDQLGA